jgi:hypothetical protein
MTDGQLVALIAKVSVLLGSIATIQILYDIIKGLLKKEKRDG